MRYKSRFQRHCLIIGLICLTIAVGAAVELCRADTEIYTVVSVSDNLGYDNGSLDVVLNYRPPENDTENKVESIGIGASYNFFDGVMGKVGFSVIDFESNGSSETGKSAMIGAGYRF